MENYIEHLTAKNSEYIHVVTRKLVKIGKSDDEIKAILSDILPKIVEAQDQRVLAKDILGTPSEFTAQYAPAVAGGKSGKTGTSQNDNETPVLMWLDSSLLMLGILALMNGLMAVFSKNAKTYGLITLVTMSLAAGFVMYLMFRLIYKPQSEGKKTASLKTFGTLTLGFLGWITIFSLTMLLPKEINFSPVGYVTAAIGALALGSRYLLKRKYHIKSTLATQPSQNSKKA
ncbi:DUF1129 family protein [Pseudolactococcus reticulitermitis]|uniref:DUF1129 domain-containing protein n=1 Tax=Pseudolactococcus reticulitermitis TaxID=2025039 RepID=A0A224WYD8_9LACT|nr:DUF1129 family protein [Lactococcus reticulitermitis]GAX47159.1 hypothetical protein RsY01_741 [Lactococcus reticulitermitis]